MKARFTQTPFVAAATVAAFSIILLTGCGEQSVTGGDALPEARLQTDWYAQPEMGGFFQAEQKGFYQEAGVDVEVLPSSPTMVNIQAVCSGKAEFGITRIDDLILAAERGMPVLAVMAYLQRTPIALVVHGENPAESIADLDGSTMMLQPGRPFHSWMRRAFDIDFKTVAHDYGMSRFLSDPDKRFVQQVYLTNEPYYLENEGVPYKLFSLAEAGYGTFLVLYTTQDYAEENPEIVREVVRASARGWLDYMTGDPTPAFERIAELNPKMNRENMAWTHEQMKRYQVVRGDFSYDEPFFQMEKARVDQMRQMLLEQDYIQSSVPYEKFISWEFLPQREEILVASLEPETD
jgi:NitT/TauT family transport system substrate-binding protein